MCLDIDSEAIENPIYESHKRGSNWAAILVGKNAASMDRQFLPQKGSVIDVSGIHLGLVLEIAGDYTSSGGNKTRNRIYGVVADRNELALVLDIYASDAKALSAANKGIKSIEADDEPLATVDPYVAKLADAVMTEDTDAILAVIDEIIEDDSREVGIPAGLIPAVRAEVRARKAANGAAA